MSLAQTPASLPQLFKKLQAIPDYVFDLYQLSLDPTFEVLDATQKAEFAQGCSSLGCAAAASFDMDAIQRRLASWNVKVISVQKSSRPAVSPHHVVAHQRSQARLDFRGNSGTIALYTSEIQAAYQALVKAGLTLSYQQLENLLLAHETYHLLELTTIGKTEDLMPKVSCRTKLARRRTKARPVATSSEVAAHAFARKVTHFPISPVACELVVQSSAGTLDQHSLTSELARLAATA